MLFDNLPEGWEITTLGEVCKLGGGSIQTGPFGSQLHASDYVDDGIPSIMPANIKEGRVSEDGIARITIEDAARLSRYIVRKGDIIYSRRGDVEKCALIRKNEDGWLCGTGCLRVRLGDGIVDPVYCLYFLSHPETKEWISRHAVGATMPNLNTGILSDVPFLLPSMADQERIARILGALDDKIELNQKMNQTLEEIAKAIFKSWFVDFDPVHAKAEGRPTGLSAEISDLFPDAFVDSEIGEIPAGWNTTTVSFFVELHTKSINPSNCDEVFDHFSIPAFDNGSVPVADAGTNIKSNKTLMPSECLLVSKLNPDTPRIWYPNKAKDRRQICSTEFLAFTPRIGGRTSFLWGLFTSDLVSGRMTAMVTGTSKSHQRVKPRDVLDITVTATPSALVEAFCKVASPMLERTLLNKEETTILSDLRDTLLPKLISGELRIPDAEKFLQEAGV